MKFSSFFPPLGLIAAFLGAASTAVLLLDHGYVPPNRIEVAPQDFQGSGSRNADFALPPRSDGERAIALFESRPLLAEGRKRPKLEEEAPPVEQQSVEEDVEIPLEVEDALFEPALVTQPDTPQIAMVGMMEIGGAVSVLIRDLLTGEENWLQENEMIGPWTLARITQTSVQLEADGAEITFHLFTDQVP